MSPNNLNLDPGLRYRERVQPHEAFRRSLDALALNLPEVEDNKALIEAGGEALIQEFGIQAEVFNDGAHTLFFAAIAERYGKLEQIKDQLGVGEYTREKEFIGDATALLALDKMARYDEVKSLIDSDSGKVGEGHVAEVYDRFTNKQVTQEVQAAIDSGLLDAVKRRLGVTAENEDPYVLRVMNVAQPNQAAYGMQPTVSKELEGRPLSDSAWNTYFQDNEDFQKYERGLVENGKVFWDQLRLESDIPLAWITVVDGQRTLCLPLPFAEKILYTDEARSKYYSQEDWDRDFALLEHEYTHTQGGLSLDESIYYGIGIEERRAELFSGDKHGYQDIKSFIFDFSVISGVNVASLLEKQTKGGNPAEIYAKLAKAVGLQRTLEFALTVPKAYLHPTRKLQQHINDYLGGPDSFLRKVYGSMIASGKGDEIDRRLKKWANDIKDKDTEFWADYRRGSFGLNFMTDKYEEYLARARAVDQS